MIQVETTANGRTYLVGGNKIPSVTTILGLLNKPALVPWAAKITVETFNDLLHEYYVPEDCCFVVPDTALPDMLDTAKKAHRAKKTEAASIGTRVHDAIQRWIESGGTLEADSITDEYERRGLNTFLDWLEQHKVNIISWEEIVSDGKYFAGRYDLLCDINGVRTVLDFKTSNAIYDEVWLQTAAYGNVLDVDQVAVLRIDKETGELEYQARPYSELDYSAFMHLAKYYKLTKENKK